MSQLVKLGQDDPRPEWVATMSARGRVNPGQRTLQRTDAQGCSVPIVLKKSEACCGKQY